MIITWTLNTENAGDVRVLAAMNRIITFVKEDAKDPEKTETMAKREAPAKPAEKTPLKAVDPEPEPEPDPKPDPKPKPKKSKQPKEKSPEQLGKMTLVEIIEHLKPRKTHSLLEARYLAKHYAVNFGETASLIEILHTVGANNFDDLKDASQFIAKAIAMAEEKMEPIETTIEEDFLDV